MSRKRKELPVLEGVEIIDVAAEGNALARVNDMVVFVPFGAPGDVADARPQEKQLCRGAYRAHDQAFGYQGDSALRAFRDMRRMPLAASAV